MTLKSYSEQPDQIAMAMLIQNVYAYDPDTGAYLKRSGGRSHFSHKWFLFFSDSFDPITHEIRPYREWRTVFRVWNEKEAIELANKKLSHLIVKGKAHVSRLFGNGEKRDLES